MGEHLVEDDAHREEVGALVEALALAHDIGHPPFGHAGEKALDAAMRKHGFDSCQPFKLHLLSRIFSVALGVEGRPARRFTEAFGYLRHFVPRR